jgi:predicted aspartyl protease
MSDVVIPNPVPPPISTVPPAPEISPVAPEPQGFGSVPTSGQAPVNPTIGRQVSMDPVNSSRAFAKLGVFVAIVLVFGTVTTVTITKNFTVQARRLVNGTVFSADLKDTVWQSYGAVPEAELMIPIEGKSGGEVEYPFLLDTGAVVSSLPREMAEKLGYDLAFLPRQTFKGFGNTTSFAYEGEITLRFGSKIVRVPVVFTEASGSRALLGRKGMFDKFTIVVDHKNKMVEIRE